MAHYNPDENFYGGQAAGYGWQDATQGDGISFNMETDFGSEQQFQAFDYTQNASAPGFDKPEPVSSGYYAPTASYAGQSYMNTPAPYSGQLLTPGLQQSAYTSASEANEFEDEPPLLEELGINPDHIVQKTLAVLNPFRTTDASILQDTDLAGPLVFCLAFGGFLLLSGKVHFSYIYGIGVLGCLAVYALLNLMAVSGVSIGVTVSVLGYCLLPMVALSGLSIVLSLQGLFGIVLTSVAVLWCCLSASKLFVTALAMDHQQPLVAYPCALLYAVFALLTIF